jgi:hypothetical protein
MTDPASHPIPRPASLILPCRGQEFKALQQHIDDLTEEKFMLQVGGVGLLGGALGGAAGRR